MAEGRTKLVDGLFVAGNHVTRGMQCMILGSTKEGCSRGSVAMWLHYWTGWSVRDCDKAVDSVVATCTSSRQNERTNSSH